MHIVCGTFVLKRISCPRLWDLDSMEPIGYTPSDSNQVRAIAFSSLGSVMCSAVKDSLKIWDLDPSVSILYDKLDPNAIFRMFM